jgi:hypothetical protein
VERWTNQSRGRPMRRPREKPPSHLQTRNPRRIVRNVLNGVLNSSTHMTHPSAASGRMMARASFGPNKGSFVHSLHEDNFAQCFAQMRKDYKKLSKEVRSSKKRKRKGKKKRKNYYSSSDSSDSSDSE